MVSKIEQSKIYNTFVQQRSMWYQKLEVLNPWAVDQYQYQSFSC